MRRVVVTGIGIVSSIGNNTQEALASLRKPSPELYLFVDAPGKMGQLLGLVYETPSKVLTIPLEFEFKNIPLP